MFTFEEITDLRRAVIYTSKAIDGNLEASPADRILADRLEALDEKLKDMSE